MIYELKDVIKVNTIFEGWEETMIYSCLQNVMGKIYVTDLDNPKSAMAKVGCFTFYAGEINKELIITKPDGFVIMVPQNEEWARLIEECFKSARKIIRYATKKDTLFSKEYLQSIVDKLPKEFIIKTIDSEIYDRCLLNSFTTDLVSSFETKEEYLRLGRGKVIMRDLDILAGASSFSRYKEGIEVEVDTIESERRKGLATAVCAALILDCLNEGLYPSWDAHNLESLHLSKKLGYEFAHEYVAYEVFNR